LALGGGRNKPRVSPPQEISRDRFASCLTRTGSCFSTQTVVCSQFFVGGRTDSTAKQNASGKNTLLDMQTIWLPIMRPWMRSSKRCRLFPRRVRLLEQGFTAKKTGQTLNDLCDGHCHVEARAVDQSNPWFSEAAIPRSHVQHGREKEAALTSISGAIHSDFGEPVDQKIRWGAGKAL